MSIYVVLGLLLVLSFILKSPKFKGFIGEKSVSYQLNKLDKEKYLVLHDITIPSIKGKTTQIDHVVVSENGVFVIETKNYTGWILGDEKADYWTQVIYKRKERLYNPLRQNYGHIQALKALLGGMEEVPFISIVCFSARADLKVNVVSEVIYTKYLVSTINKYRGIALGKNDVQKIYDAIQKASLKDGNVKREHVKALKNDMIENTIKIAQNKCPKCDGKLMERTGKYGRFKGCGNYPKCRFVLKNV
ncbi:NERD domain-containing protein [Paenibacillus sp. Soil750]|uniref:NERD domain-containing protein n=1 Tax=Paenibacillus sp. Soil750 TaxID=1736398 RepID=UPI000701EECC|nr:NERD domain-containing protein [Paenibacillus sp. Soil750]KRE70880.1 NERD nuclease [Paenibacillus sp. Soil750]